MKNKRTILMALLAVLIVAMFTGCESSEPRIVGGLDVSDIVTGAAIRQKSYSPALEGRIALYLETNKSNTGRPDYLPPVMYRDLPEIPDDFYRVRVLVETGRIADLEDLEPQYWQQPEFFPNFESIGVPVLLNAPENRWGAWGMMSYPSESLIRITAGDSIDMTFFVKSSYLVETYQGIAFQPVFPNEAVISQGFRLPDGSGKVIQNKDVAEYFDIRIRPNPFVLAPNFPLFKRDGTVKVTMTLTAKKNTPPGNYAVALDLGPVPQDFEKEQIKKYLNAYVGSGFTKLNKPFFTAFIHVNEEGEVSSVQY